MPVHGVLPVRLCRISPIVKLRLLPFVLLSCALAFSATMGNFSGKIVNGSAADSGRKWIYIQGSKGIVRRVDISQAKVSYASPARGKHRSSPPSAALRPGTEVRVTASQDDGGEWKASEVHILAEHE